MNYRRGNLSAINPYNPMTSRSSATGPEYSNKPCPTYRGISEQEAADIVSSLNYDRETGVFTWKTDRPNQVAAGSAAGCLCRGGYLRIHLRGRKYEAHRLAWFLAYGEWPALLIDHIDRNRRNNAIANLRQATPRQNSMNKANGESIGGVSRERFRARIRVHGKDIHLGSFDTYDEAHQVFLAAREKYYGSAP